MSIQPIIDLEKWHKKKDPWGYEKSSEDRKRKNILISEIPSRKYKRVLDIGCGQGFITKDLPGENIIGVDISRQAILHAKKINKKGMKFVEGSLYEFDVLFKGKSFDLIIITGVLYPQYIGNSNNLIYKIIDDLLVENGILVCVHIDDWYKSRFPYLLVNQNIYDYKEYLHRLEVYVK